MLRTAKFFHGGGYLGASEYARSILPPSYPNILHVVMFILLFKIVLN